MDPQLHRLAVRSVGLSDPSRFGGEHQMSIKSIIGTVVAVAMLALVLHRVITIANRGTYDAQYRRVEGNQHNRPMESTR